MRVYFTIFVHHSNILPYIHSHSLRESDRLQRMISYSSHSSFLHFVSQPCTFFRDSLKISIYYKRNWKLFVEVIETSVCFSPCLGILIACAPLIVKQLLTWFAKILSDEKHCRQYMQKCFFFLMFSIGYT